MLSCAHKGLRARAARLRGIYEWKHQDECSAELINNTRRNQKYNQKTTEQRNSNPSRMKDKSSMLSRIPEQHCRRVRARGVEGEVGHVPIVLVVAASLAAEKTTGQAAQAVAVAVIGQVVVAGTAVGDVALGPETDCSFLSSSGSTCSSSASRFCPWRSDSFRLARAAAFA